MKIHLTCNQPTRSHVLTVHAARELLRPAGHRVSVSWPEAWNDEQVGMRIGLNRAAINEADVIVHVCRDAEPELPAELTTAMRFGTPVIRLVRDGGARSEPGEADAVVTRLEELEAEVCRVHAASLG